MKLMIEIPEEVLKTRRYTDFFGCGSTMLTAMLDSGTPLDTVLGEIRAEIKALSNANPSYWHSGDMVEREEVFEIIDKHKAESEDKE